MSYSTNAGFLRSKIRLAGKGSEGIYSSRPAAATLPVSAFLSFSLAVGHGRFSSLADGTFHVLGLLDGVRYRQLLPEIMEVCCRPLH